MEVVINVRHGGFGLSEKAFERLIELGVPATPYDAAGEVPEGTIICIDNDPTRPSYYPKYHGFREYEMRSHPLLVRVVKELGSEANGRYAKLKIIEIPDDVEWTIEEYDGWEWVAEAHRTWE